MVYVKRGSIGIVPETKNFVLEESAHKLKQNTVQLTSSLATVEGSFPMARIWAAVMA